MKQITEPGNKIPVIVETDVLVVGGGPSGIAAAVAAAREGAHTTIIERNSCFGGNITQAMVESIFWYRHENTLEAGGIQLELEKKAKEMGGTKKDPQSMSISGGRAGSRTNFGLRNSNFAPCTLGRDADPPVRLMQG